MTQNIRLSIVVSTHQAKFEAVAFKGDFEANITRIAVLGYDGVELAIRDPSLVDADQLVRILERHRLKVPAIGTGQAWGEERLSFTSPDAAIRRKAVSRIKSHILLAGKLNALVIIGLIRGITPPGQAKNRSMQLLVECLQECTEAGTTNGVGFALEPLNRYETDLVQSVEEGLELIDQVGAPNLGLLLDTFHMNIEEPDILASINKAGRKISHFHVADSNRWYPGAGHLDFMNILEALQSTGYAGWVSGEFTPLPDSESAAKNSIDFLRQIIPA